jgi:hypothetical protein
MPRKPYKTKENAPMIVGEPVAAYQKTAVETSLPAFHTAYPECRYRNIRL